MHKRNEKIKAPPLQESSTQTTIKTFQSHSKSYCEKPSQTVYHFNKCISYLEQRGKLSYGHNFKIHKEDYDLIYKLLVYFIRDHENAKKLDLNLNKGILLSGPIGCGKTSLMNLMRYFVAQNNRHIIKSCRDISFEFIKEGYGTIEKYNNRSFNNTIPKIYCFDDLGTEQNLKYFGNECNVMAEILLSRYDQFISKDMITHITTNLSATEIEEFYGNRVRSRMREMFNLLSFGKLVKDKRK